MTGLKEHLLVLCLFLILVMLFTLSFALNLDSAVISSRVDNLLNVWIFSWNGHALRTSPTGLFQANMNYPSADSLAFSEHLFTFSLLAAPVAWITGNPVLAYNLISLLGFALCGYTMYLLVKYLTGKRMSALAAGVFFTFVPYHFSTIVHVHVSLYCLQPLILLFLFRYFDQGRPRELVGLGAAFLAQALLGWYQLAFSSIPIAIFFLWRILSRDRRQQVKKLLLVAGVLLLCMAVVIPFAMPYFRLRRNMPESEREPALNVIARAHLVDYVRVLPQNWFYDKLGFFKTGSPGEGNALFPGFMILPLFFLALFFLFGGLRISRAGPGEEPQRQDGDLPSNPEAEAVDRANLEANPPRAGPALPGPPERIASPRGFFLFFALLGLVCFTLSLGPDPGGLNNIFYKVLHKLPFYGFVRFPVRYHIMVLMSLAVVAGYGCAALQSYVQSKRGRKWALAAALTLIALMLLEFTVVGLPRVSVPVAGDVPQVYRDLADIEGAVVVEVPMPFVSDSVVFEDPLSINFGTLDNLFKSADWEQSATYFSVYHWKKLVNGMSGYYPIFYRRTLVEMQAFPGTRAMSFLRGAGVNHILARWDDFPASSRSAIREALEKQPGVELVRDYDDGMSLYRLSGTDNVDAAALDLPVYLPEKAGPGAGFDASLGFQNNGDVPFVNLSERRQHLEAEWWDDSGKTIHGGSAYFYAPFFIAGGGGASAHFSLQAPPQAGSYSLTLTATDGILEGMTWEKSMVIDSVVSSADGEGTDGELAWAREEGEDTFYHTGEVLSLDVHARNSGETQWLRGTPGMAGSVHVAAVWRRGDILSYEVTQIGMLPCDVSPGQELSFPVVLQAPRDAGEYTLTLWLDCVDARQLGTPLEIPVRVGDSP
jgi:hypothetical protein